MSRATLAGLGIIVSIACSSEPTPPVAAVPAPAGAVAVSADMCAQHGVLEALCTKCNPRLAAVFQAKGDWCPEHGFPESICPTCHPERGGRPPAGLDDLTPDPSPPDGIRVRLASVEVADVAGIRTVPAQAAKAEVPVVATATIAYDATKVAHLNPRAAGVIRSLMADVGTRVAAGDALATIESAAIGEGHAKIDAARARLTLARANLARMTQLSKEGSASLRELGEARSEHDSAVAELGGLKASMALVGKTDGATYRIDAPIAGVVTRRTASIGGFVDTDDVLFEVVDTAAMWAEIEVPESELPLVREDMPVVLTIDAIPGRTFEGRITYVAPEVDAHSRTVLARALLDNSDRTLRANMFGRATLSAPRPANEDSIAMIVPQSAIQSAKQVHLVFVRVAPDLFEGRRVTPGRQLPESMVEVRGRLTAGEPVVSEGSFLLKTETLKDSIGAGCAGE